ncbi:MAG: hypothetical protein AB7N76_07830 [Planctomycetota bacterium]
MSDARLRELERRYRESGAEEDRAAWLRAAARAAGDRGAVVVELRQVLAGRREEGWEARLAQGLLEAVSGSYAVVDLSGVALLEAPVLAALFALRRALAERGGELAIAAWEAYRRTALERLSPEQAESPLRARETVAEALADWQPVGEVRLEFRSE